jgi:Sigma-70, region 4
MATNAAQPIDPYPDSLGGDGGSLALSVLAALHRLPARERAALTLTDVAGFGRREVAVMTGTSEAWVERTVRRVRRTIPEAPAAPGEATERRVVAALADALEQVDAAAVGELLADDVALACTRRWAVYRGRHRVAAILCARMTDERLRLLPTRANGQPAFGCYLADPRYPTARARGLLAITLAGDRVSELTRFWDNRVLPYFGLPDALPADV